MSSIEPSSLPAWTPCELCGDFLCTAHGVHVADCACPPIEEWGARGLDPYRDPAPEDFTTTS